MFLETRKTAVVLIAVCSVAIIITLAVSFLLNSEDPESITVESKDVPVPARAAERSGAAPVGVPVPGSAAIKRTEKEDPPPQDNVFSAPWGSAEGELGRRVPEEGAPEGPMSFMVAEDGRVYVLDQINQRVQIFKDGKFSREIKIPGDTFQDLAVDENGRVVLLDRLVQKAVVYLEPEVRVPLEGPHVPEGGGVTGLFINDGAWVEVEHQKLVRIADTNGKPDPDRPWVPGRHSADGAWLLLAAKEGKNAAKVTLQPGGPGGSPVVLKTEFDDKVLFLTALESDPEGNIYLGARLERAEVLVILKPDGSELGRVVLPVQQIELEQFRALRMGMDGGIYRLHFSDSGATLGRIEW
jgi:hypothetical protein